MTTLQYTHKAVCAVCFCEHYLNSAKGSTDHPIRHGFSAYHIVHGQTGGWHSAPCGGISFPHFGVSTAGTEWALKGVLAQLEGVDNYIAELNTKPGLYWSYQDTERVSRYGTKERRQPIGDKIERDIKPGMAAERIDYKSKHGYNTHVTAPSYEQFWNSKMNSAQGNKQQLETHRDQLTKAIKEWFPNNPAYIAKLVKKVEMVHLARTVGYNYDREAKLYKDSYTAPKCKRVPVYEASKFKTSANPAEVTCKRCSKAS